MATETEIPESVYLKKGERSDNALSSETLDEKVTELLGNKAKQLEFESSQPLETSSQVVETVNTLETGKPTNESETFIQALSIPMVTSNTLESCEATTTEDQEESKATKIEDFKEGIPNVDEQVKAISTQTEPEEEATENEDKYDEKAIEKEPSDGIGPEKPEAELGLQLSEGDNDDVISSQDATCGDQKETTTAEHATTMADFKEQDPSEKPGEFLKEETEDKLTEATEACEPSENETKENREEKPDESVKKSEEEGDNEEMRLGVQIEEKMEQNGLPHNITTDACISTQTTSEVKVTEHDEKNEEEAGKSDSPSIKEVCEESGEKVEYQEQAVNLVENDMDIENEQEVIMLKKDQGKDEVINVKDVTFKGGFEEKIQQSEDNDHEAVKAKESIEEDAEEVRTVETPEKTEQQKLINVIPTDVCIATQIEPEEKVTENEERNYESANENDDGQTKKSEEAESEEGLKLPDSSIITLKENETASQDEDQRKEQELYMSEKGQTQSLAEEDHEAEVTEIKDGQKENCDNLLINEAFKETDSEKVEFESVEVSDSSNIELKEKAVAILSKDEAEEKEKELNMSEQGQEEDVVTCSQDATLKVGETTKENSKEMKTENFEQQGLLHAITTDDGIASQAELQEEVIKNEEKAIEVEVKAIQSDGDQIQSDGDQKEKSDNLFVKEVCEETDLKKTEAEEGIQISDSSNMLVSSQDAAPEEDLQEKSYYNEGNKTKIVETRESIDEIESSVKTEEETEQQKSLHVITTDSCSSTQTEVPAETFEIVEKNEEAIENDDGQMNLESMDKEQELKMSEVQGGGDDLKTSQKEDEKKSEIGQHATTVEAGDFGATTEDIIKDEAKAIDVQEANMNEDGENAEREQMPEGIVNLSSSEIEQDQHTKEIIPSVESNAEEDVFISTQTESPEEATKNDEKATETDSDRKEKSDNPLVKEVCDETNLEKSECEKRIEFPETYNLNPDEKSIPVVTKDEDQEKEQELKDETAVSEEIQEKSNDGEGNKDKIVEARESIQKDIEEQEQEQERENKLQNESNEPELVETRGCVDDTQEIKSNVETKEYAETKPEEDTVENEESKDEDATENDDDRTKMSESPLVKEVCETTNSDKAESEEAVKLSDSFSTTLDENEMSKEENLEQEQETKISEIRGDEHDVISSQNASIEETKENTIGQHSTTVAYFEEGQGVSAKTEEIIKEEAEDESIDAQKASKQCENDANDKAEQNPEESVDKSVNSCLKIAKENIKEDEETNKEIEADLDADSQPNRTVDGSEMKDEVVSTEKMPLEVGQSKEQYVEDIQTCLKESLSEKTEDEITKKNEHLSYDKIEDKDGNTNTEDKNFLDGRTREIEVSTLEHAPVEEKNSDLDEVSKENFTNLKETTTVEPQEDSTPSNSLETSTEDSSNLEKVKAESENLPKDDLESGSEVQIPEVLPTSEESKQKEEHLNSETIMHEDEEKGTITKDISSDEKQATGIMQETFEEACEETSSEKAELEERLKLSDSSNMEINEKAVTFTDEDQEKDQDVNISIEGQSKDNVTSSHDAVSEKENLQARSYQSEGDEHEFLKTGESVDEDTKETKSSVESKENKFETPLFKEVCETTTLEKAEPEEGVKHSEAYDTKPDENEIVSKEENLEKEQELTMSEVQGDEDDVTSTNEVIKETTISQPANTVGNFEEGQDLSEVTKEIIEEEAEDKSIDVQEANKECQDGAKDKSEQNLEESVGKPVKSCVEIVEGHFTEDEAGAGYSNEIEAKLDAENQVDGTENRGEIEDDVFLAEKIPLELGQPKELNVEEIEACLAKTVTEKTEYEITKKDNDSSHDSIEDTNGNTTTIEENCTFEHEPVEEQNGGLDGVSKEILTDLNETAAVEAEDITPSGSLGTSTEDTSNSEKAKAESESLPMEDLVSISEEQIPEVLPKSEDLAIATHADEEKITATEETSTDQESEKLYISTEENVTQLEQVADNNSLNGERDKEEDVTQEDQLNSTEDCSEMVKDVILTKEIEQVTSEIQNENEKTDFEEQVVDKESCSQNQKEMAHEISYPDPIPVGKPEMTEEKVNALTGQDLQVAEGISCESKVKNESVDQAPKEEQITSLEEAATVEPEVDLSKIESTAYPSESEKLPIQALEPACDVQTSEVITESEDSKVKEERIVLETVGHTDENKVEEEQIIRTDKISSASNTEEENERSSFLQNTEEKSLSKEKLELLGEVKPTSESVIVEVQVNETKSQPEHSDITSENIVNDQTLESKLEHTKEKKLEDVQMDLEEDVTQAPEDQIKGVEEKNETEKNVILTDQVVVEPTEENERIEVEGQILEEDSSTTKLDITSTSNQMELTNEEIEYSKPIPVGNTEETEMKAESHLELGNIPAADDLDCLSKASSTLEASNTERDDGTEKSITTIREVKDDNVDETSKDEVVPVVEDITKSELAANLPEIKSTDIPSDSQDSMKLTEGIPCSTQETIEVKNDELISEVETHEALVKMGIQEEHPETTNDKCDTPMAGVSSEKLLDEPEKLDAKDDNEEIAEGDKKALEESYQDAVAGATGHEHFSQTEELKELTEKLESMIPSEEHTPPTDVDQTNELTLETDETKVEHGSLSNKDKNPELEEEEFAKPFSEDQRIKERYAEEEMQSKCGVEDTEEKSGNEVVQDVIVNEILVKDETTKESLSIKDNNNEKAIQNQPISVTQEVSQIERLSSSPYELLEKKDLVEDSEKPKLVAETLEIKDKTFTVMKESNEAIEIPAPEIENSESMVTEERIIEADADKEKERLEDPRADDPAEAVSGSISSSLEKDIDRSEESRGHGEANKPEEKPTEAFEITSEVAEIVPNDREVSAISTDGLLETSPEMLLPKHDPKLTTTPENIEDEIKDKEVGELQVSTLNSEIVEGKQDGPDDIQNKEKEPVQPQEQEKLIDPPSDIEIKEQEKITHCGSQESSEENALSQNDKKIEDSPTLQSVEKEIMQGLDKEFEEAPVIEVQKNEKGLDRTTDIRAVDVVNDAEGSEVEPPKLDTKKETWEFVNEENQRDRKNEVDEHKEAATLTEDVKSLTPELEVPSVIDETAEKEGYNEDSKDKNAEAYEAEKGILTDNKYPESTFGISKPTEVPGMKQEPLELNAPTTLGTEATEDLKISQKYVANLSHEQAEPTEKSFTVDAEDLNTSKASRTEAQCDSEVTQDERKTSNEKKKSESAESTQGKTEVAENLNKENEPALTKDQQVGKEETVDSAVKTDEENEEDNEKLGSCSDAPVMVEASKDMDVKVHKKSQSMLSGVGSKVKHSIAKVKKAITGKSFHPKPTSPKERDEVITQQH